MARLMDQGAKRGEEIAIVVDDQRITAFAGETVATALLAAGIRALRRSPRNGEQRGPFCFMGSCQECLVRIDGQPRLACQQRVVDGLAVETGIDHE